MTTILLIVIAALVLMVWLQSSKQTATMKRIERQVNAGQPPEEISPTVIAAARKPGTAGLIEAIKQYRTETGASLDEAKPKIEALRQQLGVI